MANSPICEPRLDGVLAMPASKQNPSEEEAESRTLPSSQTDRASDRRLKKRESDRKCQRLSRERKNARIIYLESLVDQLKRVNTSGEMDALFQTISDLQKERDTLQGKLATIGAVLNPNTKSARKKVGIGAEAAANEPWITDSVTTETQKEGSAATFNLSPGQEAMQFPPDLGVYSMSGFEKEPSFHLPGDTMQLETANYIPNAWAETPAIYTPKSPSQRPYLGMPHPTEPTRSTSLFSSSSCACGHSKTIAKFQLNHWHHVNSTLGSWMEWSSVARTDDTTQCFEDIVVRAMVKGWDAVGAHVNVHPMWTILRGVDESLYKKYADGIMNRLAILYIVSRMLLAHIEPSQAIYSQIPPFALESYIQDPYAYASNFVIWPGIRRALMFHEHKYCSNHFWRMFTNCIRIQWSYEIRDCFLYNTAKDLYSISPTFLSVINNFYTLGISRDLFEFYPELRGSAVAIDEIPASIATTLEMPSCQLRGTQNQGPYPLTQWQQQVSSPLPTSRGLNSQGAKQNVVGEHERGTRNMPEALHTSTQEATTATKDVPDESINTILMHFFGTSYGPTEEEPGGQRENNNHNDGHLFQIPTWNAPGQAPRSALPPEISDFFVG